MELKFQENFLWGAATSGPQTEGPVSYTHLVSRTKILGLHHPLHWSLEGNWL